MKKQSLLIFSIMPVVCRKFNIPKIFKRSNMKFLVRLSSISLFLFFPSFLKAEIDKEIHNLCKESRDYLGCIEANQNNSTANKVSEEDCWGTSDNYWCTAKEGYDFLGMPKLVGWNYKENKLDLRVNYNERIPRKVKVKGEYGRYIEVRQLVRKSYSPSAGSSPTVYGGGQSSCYDSGYGTISCTHTPPTVIPGSPSMPGGVGYVLWKYIIDCEEETHQTFTESNRPIKYGTFKKKSRWVPLSSKKASWLANDRAKDFCGSISSLPVSDFKKYE